jgi:restriction endonuclease S subunit
MQNISFENRLKSYTLSFNNGSGDIITLDGMGMTHRNCIARNIGNIKKIVNNSIINIKVTDNTNISKMFCYYRTKLTKKLKLNDVQQVECEYVDTIKEI